VLGRDSQARQSSGATCCVGALNARTRVRGQVHADALERSGPRPRGRSALKRGRPRSRGGAEPSSEAEPARGGGRASSEADFARGSVYPSSEADFARGSIYPSSEADFTRGASTVSSRRAAGAAKAVFALLGVQVDLRLRFLQVLNWFPLII
jgi:hypothetical protein